MITVSHLPLSWRTLCCAGLTALLMSACGGGTSNSAPAADAAAQQSTSIGTGSSAPSPSTTGSVSDPAPSVPAAPSTQPAPPRAANQVVEYYGASSVWGAKSGDTGKQVAVTEPKAFQSALPANTPYTTVVNRGISGATARDWLYGSPNIPIPWAKQMADSKASIVIMQIGINDMNTYSLSEYTSALTELVKQTRAAGKVMVLETPGPADNGALDAFARGMIDVAAKLNVPLIDQYTYWTDYMAANNVAIRTLVPDGTHPSDAWYIQKGQYAAGVFTKYFP